MITNNQLCKIALLEKGWGGYETNPIPKELLKSVQKLLDMIENWGFKEPTCIPTGSSTVNLEWHKWVKNNEKTEEKSLEIEFDDKNTVHYLKWHESEGIEEEEIFSFSDTKRIKELIEWFNGKNI